MSGVQVLQGAICFFSPIPSPHPEELFVQFMRRTTPVNKPENETPSAKKPKVPSPQLSQQSGVVAYLKGVKAEWGKISWPTWPQVWGQTLVVIVMTTIMSVGLFIIDTVFNFVIRFLVPPA